VYPVADALTRLGVPFAFANRVWRETIESRFAHVKTLEKPVGYDELRAAPARDLCDAALKRSELVNLARNARKVLRRFSSLIARHGQPSFEHKTDGAGNEPGESKNAEQDGCRSGDLQHVAAEQSGHHRSENRGDLVASAKAAAAA